MRPVTLVLPVLTGFAAASIAAGAASAQTQPLAVAKPFPLGNAPAKRPGGDTGSVAIVGAGVGGTEFLVAEQISNAVASAQEAGPNGETALRVLAIPGSGGLQNIRDVLARPDIDFGIVPVPVLNAAAATNGMANLQHRIAYVAPLYIEEVHVLAGSGVSAITDLAGKTVSVGPEGSSTEIIANAILSKLGPKIEARNLDARASVQAVRDGSLAAAFLVSGKPVADLVSVSAAELKLLSLPDDSVPEGFSPATFAHADYPALIPDGQTVTTYGVKNVLFGYAWPLRSNRGRVEQTFLAMLMYRLPDLQVGTNHPKWREINVAGTLPGWNRLPAMQAWLAKAHPRAAGPVGEAEFESFLTRTGTKVTGTNREALYRDFLRWRTAPVVGTGR